MPIYSFDEIAFNSTEKKKPCESDKSTYLGLEHLDSGCLFVRRFGSETAPIGEKLVMKKGDVLFGKRRAYQKKVAIAPFDGIFSAHGMVLRPKEKVVDKRFFPMFISSDYFLDAAIKISVGSLSPTINWNALKRLKFNLPPLEEQRKLADLLWSAYELKESYKRLLAASDEMAKSRFVEMFGGRFNEVKIGDWIKTTSGGTPSSKCPDYYNNGTIPWLTSGEVNQGIILKTQSFITQKGLENSSAKWLPANCVVIAMYGATAGKVGLTGIPLTTNQAVCALLPADSFNEVFLLYACRNKEEWMLANRSGAAQPNISQTIIKEMTIPKPPLSLQKQFAVFIEQLNKSKVALQQSITALNDTIKTLLNINISEEKEGNNV